MNVSGTVPTVGHIARQDLHKVHDAYQALVLLAAMPESEDEWERVLRAATVVEQAACQLYETAVSELHRHEQLHDYGYDVRAVCVCGHTAYWHGQEPGQPEASGRCDSCSDCSAFTTAEVEEADRADSRNDDRGVGRG